MRSVFKALVVIVLLIKCVTGGNIDWGFYHKADQILEFFKSASKAVPSRVRFEDIPDSDSQFKLPLVTVTDFETGETGKEVILLVAGEHARELITAEVVYWLGGLLTAQKAADFLEWEAVQPVQATAWRSGWTKGTLLEWGEEVLKKVVFKIFPVQNIAGRSLVESQEDCLRKTISGVDLNRNWPFAWQKVAEGTDEYGGKEPLSEPETRIVKTVAQNARPQAFVNLHSGEWAMYVPWDSKDEIAPKLPDDTDDLLEKMNAYCECMKGAAGKTAGYLAMGTSMDWMYNDQHVPYPLTFEVYGPRGLGKLANGGHPRHLRESSELSTSLPQKQAEEKVESSCMSAFNPLDKEEYESTVAEWVGAILVLADHLTKHPHASAASHEAQQNQLPEPKSPPTKQDLSRHGEAVVQSAHDATVNENFPIHTLDQSRRPIYLPRKMKQDGESSDRSFVAQALFSFGYVVSVVCVAGLLLILWMKVRPREGRSVANSKVYRSSDKDSL